MVEGIANDVELGENTKVYGRVNLYGCKIGKNCIIGSFVEIRKTVVIGNNCKIQAFAFIPEGITIEDSVFIGPHVCFTNDKHPRACNQDNNLKTKQDWKIKKTRVGSGASIGANATILCGTKLGSNCFVGAGSVVTADVPNFALVYGNPAKIQGWICSCGNELSFDLKGNARCKSCCSAYSKKGNVVRIRKNSNTKV